MSIVGDWTLYYDWGCGGSYTAAGITFNNDGTFSTSEDEVSETGKWVQNDGMVLFQFDSFKTTYGGNLAGNVMVGIMSTFAGLNGLLVCNQGGKIQQCWLKNANQNSMHLVKRQNNKNQKIMSYSWDKPYSVI